MNKFWTIVFVGVMIMTTIGQARTSSDADLAVQYASSGWIEDAESRTWSYSSADAPTYVFSVNDDMTGIISAGMRLRFKQSAGTYKYAGVTAVGSYSGGVTLITAYLGTDYDLDNEAVTNVAYSAMKAPFGFPMNPDKWTVSYESTSAFTKASPSSGTWYLLDAANKLDIPIGLWKVEFSALLYGTRASNGSIEIASTLSTANNSASNDYYAMLEVQDAGTIAQFTFERSLPILSLSSKTTYYLLFRAGEAGITEIGVGAIPTYIRAVWAGL